MGDKLEKLVQNGEEEKVLWNATRERETGLFYLL
jgi:hypothetical protein